MPLVGLGVVRDVWRRAIVFTPWNSVYSVVKKINHGGRGGKRSIKLRGTPCLSFVPSVVDLFTKIDFHRKWEEVGLLCSFFICIWAR